MVFLLGATIAGYALGGAFRQETTKSVAKREYVGDEQCGGCHRSQHENWSNTIHGKLLVNSSLPMARRGCEGCHGPGSEHVKAQGTKGTIVDIPRLPQKETNALCLRCHQDMMNSHDFAKTAHSMSKMRCTDCHQVMVEKAKSLLKKPQEQLCYTCHNSIRGQLSNFTHHPVVEGTMRCQSCHDVHSGKHPAMLKEATRSLCTNCHAEKKGPFIFEHSPNVSGWGGDCASCHNPHGSPNPSMTLVADRGLCQRCHTDMTTHRPGKNCTQSGCHHFIHGSNSDSLFLVQ